MHNNTLHKLGSLLLSEIVIHFILSIKLLVELERLCECAFCEAFDEFLPDEGCGCKRKDLDV